MRRLVPVSGALIVSFTMKTWWVMFFVLGVVACDAATPRAPDFDAADVAPADTTATDDGDVTLDAPLPDDLSSDLSEPDDAVGRDAGAADARFDAPGDSDDLGVDARGDVADARTDVVVDLPRPTRDSGVPPFPGVVSSEIDGRDLPEFVVAPDEQHVFVSDAESDYCPPTTVVIGSISLVTVRDGVGSSRPVATQGSLLGMQFSADGANFVYLDDADSCGRSGTLYVGSFSGAASRMVARSVLGMRVVGSQVVYVTRGAGSYGQLWRAPLAGGAPVSLGTTATTEVFGDRLTSFAPDGSAVAFRNDARRGVLVPLSGAATPRALSTSPWDALSVTWSPDSHTLARVEDGPTGPRLVLGRPDGTGDVTLAETCPCYSIVFSPDGRRIAFDVTEGPSGTDGFYRVSAVIHPLAGGADVRIDHIVGAAAGAGFTWGELGFSPDGAYLWADAYTGSLLVGAFQSVARTDRSGYFRNLCNHYLGYRRELALTGRHLAGRDGRTAQIYNFENGTPGPDLVNVDDAAFEPTPTDPALLTRTGDHHVQLRQTDGSDPTVTLPGNTLGDAQWVGRTVVYRINQVTTSSSDLAFADRRGARAGLAAQDVLAWRTARIPTPTRVFYTRAPSAGGGLWMANLPPP